MFRPPPPSDALPAVRPPMCCTQEADDPAPAAAHAGGSGGASSSGATGGAAPTASHGAPQHGLAPDLAEGLVFAMPAGGGVDAAALAAQGVVGDVAGSSTEDLMAQLSALGMQ